MSQLTTDSGDSQDMRTIQKLRFWCALAAPCVSASWLAPSSGAVCEDIGSQYLTAPTKMVRVTLPQEMRVGTKGSSIS